MTKHDKVEAALGVLDKLVLRLMQTGVRQDLLDANAINTARATLGEALAESRRDAARYRWLRNDPPVNLCVRRHPGETERGCYLDGAPLDQAIDAAMKEAP